MNEGAMSSFSQSPQDEGYSEDPLTFRAPSSAALPQCFLQMSAQERTGYVLNIISQLPTSQVAEIVSRLRPRLYINFFEYLPNEVLLHILSFLDPVSLLNTARASREWMSLALESRLWEQLYLREGFRVNSSAIVQFEETSKISSFNSTDCNKQKYMSNSSAPTHLNHTAMVDEDSEMEDLNQNRFGQTSRESSERKFNAEVIDELPARMSALPNFSTTTMRPITDPYCQPICQVIKPYEGMTPLSNISSLFVSENCGTNLKNKLNWQYLYSQRRRLESNWEAEKYVNFQLPDPDHPEEAHYECVYTIQHSGNYLVSGSRDKTIRVWNLETRRLVRPPLRAHSGSVLCLQFDADPKEDLIVSGSSDASVVLWKFSTGQIIQRIRKAHKESVLNVQFDKRVLVTCSKDKTIKIFNRTPLHVGDPGYPADINGVNPVPTFLNNCGFSPTPTSELLMRPAYSLIGILEGHGAAVNSVQIQGDEVVSASGDRLVKVWNWPEQTCVRTLIGHSKGIACVQYDGRRIVSGSSDNEVKVFDKETGLEVASLRAHKNLVRTVQAGFGDLPSSAEEDKADAKAVDYEYFRALDSGVISGAVRSERGRPRNAGSRRPEHITAYGAKLPPGGGGGKFGRIVSGSYDETIIIWRRDKEGVWKPQHTLRQEEAAYAARLNSRSKATASIATHHLASLPPYRTQQGVEQSPTSPRDTNTSLASFIPRSGAFYYNLIDNAVAQGPIALRHALAAHPSLLNYEDYMRDKITTYPPRLRQIMEVTISAAFSSSQNMTQTQLPIYYQPNSSINTQQILNRQSSTSPEDTNSFAAIANTSNQILTQSSTVNSPPIAQNIAPDPRSLHPQHLNNMARVFKLQFDARRIICCSQTNIIVGWDFANNDQKIIEASRFFAPIE